MNKVLGIFLLSLFPLFASGQLETLYLEDWEDDNGDWWEGTNDDLHIQWVNGRYEYGYKLDDGYRYSYKNKFADPTNDWVVSVDIHSLRFDNDWGCAGLVFGTDRLGDFYVVKVNSNGYFELGHSLHEGYETISDWTESKAVKKGVGVTNKVKVSQEGNKTIIYINGSEVYTTSKLKMRGIGIGMLVGWQPTIYAFDNLKLEGVKKKFKLVKGGERALVKTNLGPEINSPYDEKGARVSPNGEELYFFSEDNPANTAATGSESDCIFRSRKKADDSWGAYEILGKPLNRAGNNAVRSISAGNTSFLLRNTYLDDGSMAGGMSVSHRDKNGWTQPEALKFDNFDGPAGDYSSACWSANGKVIIYSYDSYGETHGMMDLYVSFHRRGNKWSEPKNLGPVLNTLGDDFTPFLAADDRTLYFASDGHGGYGGADIFVSHRLDDSWTNWSEPENLGPYINTSEKESFFSVTAKGDKGYVSSRESGFGRLDLFEIDMAEGARPDPVLMLKGKVRNAETGAFIDAHISVRAMDTDEEISHLWSAPDDGHYEAILPEPKEFVLFAQRDGYYAQSKTFLVEHIDEFSVAEVDLALVPIVKGAKITSNNIFFVQSKSVILPKSIPELNRLAEILQENPKLEISIQGHTDNTGSAKLNVQLSEERAQKIKDFLIEKGVSKKRLEAKGFGGSEPAFSNSTDEGRKKNRRVEFVVIKS